MNERYKLSKYVVRGLEYKKTETRGRLAAECWCHRRMVWVSPEDIRNGVQKVGFLTWSGAIAWPKPPGRKIGMVTPVSAFTRRGAVRKARRIIRQERIAESSYVSLEIDEQP